MTRFLLFVFVLAVLIVLIKEAGVAQGWFTAPEMFYITLGFVMFGTALIYAYLVKIPAAQFTPFYLLLTVVKLIAFLAYIAVVVIKLNSTVYSDVGFFLLDYLSFTALEIAFLYRHVKSQKAS